MRDLMNFRRPPLLLALCGLLFALPASAQDTSRLDQVLDAIVVNERELAETLEQYQPLFETYLQTVKPDSALGFVPVKDSYFFGRLVLPGDNDLPEGEIGKKKTKRKKKKTVSLFDDFHSQTFRAPPAVPGAGRTGGAILDRPAGPRARLLDSPMRAAYHALPSTRMLSAAGMLALPGVPPWMEAFGAEWSMAPGEQRGK